MLNNIHYFNELINSGSLFWFCALSGSGMLIIQFMINIFGMTDQNSFDSSNVASSTIQDGGQDSADVRKFKWLSMHTITGFLMMFGWTALACQKEFEFSDDTTIGVAFLSGLVAALIIHALFKFAKKLNSSGSIYRIEDAVGKEGYLYHSIPKGGRGTVSLSLHNFTREIDAVSHHGEDLPSFMRVKIIEKSDGKTVVVAPL